MTINLIWAQTRNGIIGKNGKLPWDNLPEDMQHFRDLTIGHPVIMGSKTWESLPPRYRPLPGRRNIILTSRPDKYPETDTQPTIQDALDQTRDAEHTWIIGGGHTYNTALPYANELHITEIDLNTPGDTHAPDYNPDEYSTDPTRTTGWTTSTTGIRYRFTTLIRQGN